MDDYSADEMLVEALLGGAPEDELADALTESHFREEKQETQMEYLYLLEQFFDDCSVYAFDGWEEGVVLAAPTVSKFWVECEIKFPPTLDLAGARRLLGKNKQNKIKVKETDVDTTVRFKILRSMLDAIEDQNRIDAKKEADSEGYKDDQGSTPQDPNADPMMGGADPMMGGGGMGMDPMGGGMPPAGGGMGGM